MTVRTEKTFCRYCHAYCPLLVDVADGRAVALRPDTEDPLYGGYTCIKGRQLITQMHQPQRLRSTQQRTDAGFVPIASERALDAIADRLREIIDRHGPRAVATYNGTYAFHNSAQLAYSRAWHDALGSPSYYSSITIDQPAKVFVGSRHGYWAAGGHSFTDADVAMIIGNNPLVSHYAPPGSVPSVSPFEQLRLARKRGLKLIVIDPRTTELARRADLHLAVRPGEDATLLAGIIRHIVTHDLHDRVFCAQYTADLEVLVAALAPFTPAVVAARTGLAEAAIIAAAELFAAGPRGQAVTGTGPEMAPHANLTQHLVASLNSLCGRYYRAGERLPNPGMLVPPFARTAAVMEVPLAWGNGARSRIDPALGELVAIGMMGPVREMPTNLLADEILQPGEGRVRALICVGGNPLLAWPDQRKTQAALRDLDLLVCIDPYFSATARHAHYVIAPKLSLEREDVTLLPDPWYERPYSHYTPAIVAPEGDLLEEWEVYWGLGERLGLDVRIGEVAFHGGARPSKFDVLEAITRGSRMPLAWLRDHPGGHVFDDVEVIVAPGDAHAAARLRFFPVGVADEIAALLHAPAPDPQWTHLLVCARNKYVLNSAGHDLPALRAKAGTTNPACMHPDDIAALGLADDDLVDVTSEHGCIRAVLRADVNMQPGVLAIHHSWGVAPDAADVADVRQVGTNTNRLIDNACNRQPYTGMTRQSAIPVRVARAG